MNADRLPERITIGEKYGPAMTITDEQEAHAYFERCVEHTIRFGKTRAEAEVIERSNLGYYAGYYDDATAKRVLLLFGAAHPILGATKPTPEGAVSLGIKWARTPPASGKEGEGETA